MVKAAFLCPAYNRPHLLGNLIAMFQAQDYPDKEMVILEDSGIWGDQVIEGDSWRLVSQTDRILSVGVKRNRLAEITDAEVLVVADDDDWYFPWHISAAVEALRHRPWAQPRQALEWTADGKLTRHWVFGEPVRARLRDGLDPTNPSDAYDCCYGGQWSYTAKAFRKSGGYPKAGNGDDTLWCRAMFKQFGPSADTISARHPRPSYVYSRGRSGSWHASELGPGVGPLKQLGDMPRADPADLRIELPAGYNSAVIPDEVLPRGW